MDRDASYVLGFANDKVPVDVDHRCLRDPSLVQNKTSYPNFFRDGIALAEEGPMVEFVVRELLHLSQILLSQYGGEARIGVDASSFLSSFYIEEDGHRDYLQPWTLAPGQNDHVDALRRAVLHEAEVTAEATSHIVPRLAVLREDAILNRKIPLDDVVNDAGRKRSSAGGGDGPNPTPKRSKTGSLESDLRTLKPVSFTPPPLRIRGPSYNKSSHLVSEVHKMLRDEGSGEPVSLQAVHKLFDPLAHYSSPLQSLQSTTELGRAHVMLGFWMTWIWLEEVVRPMLLTSYDTLALKICPQAPTGSSWGSLAWPLRIAAVLLDFRLNGEAVGGTLLPYHIFDDGCYPPDAEAIDLKAICKLHRYSDETERGFVIQQTLSVVAFWLGMNVSFGSSKKMTWGIWQARGSMIEGVRRSGHVGLLLVPDVWEAFVTPIRRAFRNMSDVSSESLCATINEVVGTRSELSQSLQLCNSQLLKACSEFNILLEGLYSNKRSHSSDIPSPSPFDLPSCIAKFLRASAPCIEEGRQETSVSEWIQKDMNVLSPFRERGPDRVFALQQSRNLDDDNFLISTVIFRAITFNSKFLSSAGAKFFFTDYADFSAMVDEYAEPFPPHYKNKVGRYAPGLCNPSAYGKSHQGNKQVDCAATYFVLPSQMKVWLKEWEEFDALPSKARAKKTLLQYSSMFAFFCKKFLAVKGVGKFISVLITEDLVYRGLIDAPSPEQFANVILAYASNLGSCKLLMELGVIPRDETNSQNNISLFCALYQEVVRLLGDLEAHLMPDIFHFEYVLHKLLRVKDHPRLRKLFRIPL